MSCRAIPIKFVPAGKVPLQRLHPNSSRPSCAPRWTITPGRFAAAPELPLSGGRRSSNVRADQAASRKKMKKAASDRENEMSFTLRETLMRTAAAAAVFAAACALPSGAARAQDKPPIVMKISLAARNEALHQIAQDYAALIE